LPQRVGNERAHDYLERSFMPGRSFTGPADFNAQLAAWLAVASAGSGARCVFGVPTVAVSGGFRGEMRLSA
jgi:hypothetical protein